MVVAVVTAVVVVISVDYLVVALVAVPDAAGIDSAITKQK